MNLVMQITMELLWICKDIVRMFPAWAHYELVISSSDQDQQHELKYFFPSGTSWKLIILQCQISAYIEKGLWKFLKN